MKTISARLIPALSMVALLGVSATALAAPIHMVDEVVTKTVRIADLNLSSTAGAETLYGRIKAAARSVCRYEQSHTLAGRCQARAIDSAVKEVGSPLLASLHGSATGRTVELVAR